MKRSIERILCTHTGSLIRPREMYRNSLNKVGIPQGSAESWRLLEECVDDVVAKQRSIGLDVVNDGEYSKPDWANYLVERVSGFSLSKSERTPAYWLGRDAIRFPEIIETEFPGIRKGLPSLCCTSAITYTDNEATRRRLAILRAAVDRFPAAEAFFTVVAPGSAVFNGVNRFYATDRQYVFALADALRVEYLATYEAGLLVQVDDALLANMYDYLMQEGYDAYLRWAELRVEALNHALRGIPLDRIRYHLCFGSWRAPHTSDAPLSEIIGLVLQVNAGAYALEAASPRHEHEWRVWEKTRLPDGKILIPGVVTHHTGIVEHPQVVADRIVRLARIVGRENIIAGTDCGFAQSERVQRTSPQVMWAKLESLVEGAKIATRMLWGKA